MPNAKPPEPRILVLTFDEYPDTEFRAVISPVPLRDFLAIVAAYEEAARTMLPDQIGTMCDLFAPYSREPATRDAFGDLDPNLILGIVGEWVMGVRRAPVPLRHGSSGGGASPADSQSPSPETSSPG